MNRNNEYKALLNELDETPLKLDYTLERALARRTAYKRRSRKAVFVPVISITAVFAVFVLLVNVSPSFAYAAGRIPLIRDLAQFVAMSPSLSAAVENQYVQPIGLEQTANGITARIEYVIVDQKQLNIFYSLSSNLYNEMQTNPQIDFDDSEEPYGHCISSPGYYDIENGELREATVVFVKGSMPDKLSLKLKVFDSGVNNGNEPTTNAPTANEGSIEEIESKDPNYISTFDFSLELDPTYTSQGETIEINTDFDIDGQKLTLNTVEIYPTHMRFCFEDFPENTKWQENLKFYVENENGDRFEGVSNGITATGGGDALKTRTYMLESPYFSKSKHLTLYITNVTWLSKDMETVKIDLENKKADKLPEGVIFEKSVKKENGWILYFSAPAPNENCSYGIWNFGFRDANGTEHELKNGMSRYYDGYYDEETSSHVKLPGRFVEEFALLDYTENEVWLSPIFSNRTELDEPISIKIK